MLENKDLGVVDYGGDYGELGYEDTFQAPDPRIVASLPSTPKPIIIERDYPNAVFYGGDYGEFKEAQPVLTVGEFRSITQAVNRARRSGQDIQKMAQDLAALIKPL